jgi:sugar/nucleoside kinase (ribokinase family)
MQHVYLYGMITASTVYLIDDSFAFPQPNEYAEIKCSYPSVGGEAVNSAIMLSKFGITTKLDGNWINQDHADKNFKLLSPFNIDISRLTVKPACGTEEIVISDKTSRTIFGNFARFHSGKKQWNTPREEDIQNASMVCLDPYFKEEALHVSQMCVQHNKPYITIDCKHTDFIAQQAEALIISHELRNQEYSNEDVIELFEKYQTHCKGLIIFTFGSDELWYARNGQQIQKHSPYQITPVDTTGAGDSFRAGVAYGLLNLWDDKQIIDFASAVAACVCLSIPHTLNAPGIEGIRAFMDKEKNKTRA